MLVIELNRANYEYDVNALAHSFYSGEQVTILSPESTLQRRQQTEDEAARQTSAGKAPIYMSVEVRPEGALVEIEGRRFSWEYLMPENVLEETQVSEKGERLSETFAKDVDHVSTSEYKHAFKRFFYKTMSEYTGKTLPWGSLTGIRPTKIAYGMLEQGCSEEEILHTFREQYAVSAEKAELGLDIAKRERELLQSLKKEESYSLYIGIPFCPTTCLYCSFTSYPIAGYRKVVDAYLDCLMKEIRAVAACMEGKRLDTVYIGGGTPTTLEPEQMDRLLAALREHFDFDTVQEFTVEAGRADSITREKLETLYRHKVSRISVNPQTMNQKTLDIIGRKASVEQVLAAYQLAREVGFDNINMDLILGLPGESEADVQRTINQVTELSPDSLTVHSLAIKRASHMSMWIHENGVETLRNTDETMRIAAEGARKLGMKPYYLYRQKNMSGNFENVGYARPGKYGLYNILIMEEMQTIVALGAGSITKRVWKDGRIERCENVKDVKLYIEKIDEMIERKRGLFEER